MGYILELTLIRVDYRFDKYISSNDERLILLHLYKKMIDKHGFKKKKSKKMNGGIGKLLSHWVQIV